MTTREPWTVEMELLSDRGGRVTSSCDMPDELSARRLVDLCRQIPTVMRAAAKPLDTAPRLVA